MAGGGQDRIQSPRSSPAQLPVPGQASLPAHPQVPPSSSPSASPAALPPGARHWLCVTQGTGVQIPAPPPWPRTPPWGRQVTLDTCSSAERDGPRVLRLPGRRPGWALASSRPSPECRPGLSTPRPPLPAPAPAPWTGAGTPTQIPRPRRSCCSLSPHLTSWWSVTWTDLG